MTGIATINVNLAKFVFQVDALAKDIRREAETSEAAKRLQTIAGVGPIIATAFAATRQAMISRLWASMMNAPRITSPFRAG